MPAQLKLARITPPPSRVRESQVGEQEPTSGVISVGDQYIEDGARNLFLEEPLPRHIASRFFADSAQDALTPEFVAGNHYADYQYYLGEYRSAGNLESLMDALRSVVSAADAGSNIKVSGRSYSALIQARMALYARGMELCDEAIGQLYSSPSQDQQLETEVTRTDKHCEMKIANLERLLKGSGSNGGNMNEAPGGYLPPAANEGGFAAMPYEAGSAIVDGASFAYSQTTTSMPPVLATSMLHI